MSLTCISSVSRSWVAHKKNKASFARGRVACDLDVWPFLGSITTIAWIAVKSVKQ